MTTERALCVICGSGDNDSVFSVERSVSTDRQVFAVPVDNRFCNRCGTVWNQGGARIDAPRFYAEEYDLHGNSALSEFLVHVEGRARGESDAILEFIERTEFGPSGRILEIGCGKGILLGKFLKKHPGWSAYAVEPSLHATEYFRTILPDVSIHEGTFETAPFRDQRFDFVAVSGVLEHVPQPLEFLSMVASAIAEGGRAYVGVPNFAAKPDDLLVFDHLTRFTPGTLDQLYSRCGFALERRDASNERVWMWDLVVGHEDPPVTTVEIADARALVESHVAAIRSSINAFDRMLIETEPGELLALYGLGVLGFWARSNAGRRADAIAYLLDDNPLIWGSRKEGLEIRGSRTIPQLGVSRVFIAANPCYHERMRSNLAAVGIREDRVYA